MKNIKYLADCFLPLDQDEKVTVTAVTEQPYYYTVRLKNVAPTSSTQAGLHKFFGSLPVRSINVQNTNSVDIDISKVKLPAQTYDLRKFGRFLARHLHARPTEQKWFLGIGHFGPHFFDLNRLTHVGLYGSSGFGKSSLFRSLLAQTLKYNQNTVNYIIDPKKIDYSSYQNHPAVKAIAKSYSEWSSVVTSLVTECSFREKVFSQAFENSPTSLQEYTEMREKFGRTDLPEFKRMILWIDEAHVVFNEAIESPSYVGLAYLARKARSFGIHLIVSSQRYSDIPTTVRAQLSQIFSFYTTDNHLISEHGFPVDKMVAIVGRLYYTDTETRENHIVQCPLVNNNDAVGLAYHGLNSSAQFPGVSPLKLHKDWMQNGHIVNYLSTGSTLDMAAQVPVDKIKEYKPFRKSYEFTFQYPEWYNLVEEAAAASAAPRTTSSTPAISADDLMAEFDQLIRSANAEVAAQKEKQTGAASVETPQTAPTPQKAPTPEATRQPLVVNKSIPDFEKTANFEDFSALTSRYEKITLTGEKNLSWCLHDISSNPGLIATQLALKGVFDKRSFVHVTADLALGEKQQTLLESYLKLAHKALNEDTKSPLLVVTARDGFGKQTILESVCQNLSVPLHTGQLSDLLKLASPKDLAGKTAEEKRHLKKAFVFSNPVDALEFYNHSTSNELVMICHTEPEQSAFSLFAGEAPYDFSYMKETHILLKLDERMYSEPAVFEKLIHSVLKKHGYAGETKSLLRIFASSRVRSIPAQIEAIVNRASTRAVFAKAAFEENILKETLHFLELSNNFESHEVQIIQAVKKIDDLILHEETKRDLLDVIHRAKNLDNTRYEFTKRLRKNPRMVALFAGIPGTGKTMAAEVVACEMHKDLWLCDFSKILNAYLGETEKTLTRIFNAAKAAGCVLLLDECDALLGSRNEGSKSDRRIVNHLLMLIENFSGVLVLTTNFAEQLDEAFSRRFDVKAVFQLPSEKQMAEILENLLKPDAPLDADFDALEIVKGLRMSGGLVRNAVERALILMERTEADTLSNTVLRQAFVETFNENQVVARESRMVGIAS